jgi:hypothetical protein
MLVYEYERERVISMTDDLYYSEDRSKTSCQTQLSGVVPPRDPEGENSDLVPSYAIPGSGRGRVFTMTDDLYYSEDRTRQTQLFCLRTPSVPHHPQDSEGTEFCSCSEPHVRDTRKGENSGLVPRFHKEDGAETTGTLAQETRMTEIN